MRVTSALLLFLAVLQVSGDAQRRAQDAAPARSRDRDRASDAGQIDHLVVSVMPGYPNEPRFHPSGRHPVRPGFAVPVWGTVNHGDGSAVGAAYTWSFVHGPDVEVVDDGDLSGLVTDTRYIVEEVTFELLNGSTREVVQATLTCSLDGFAAARAVEIEVLSYDDPSSDEPLERISFDRRIAVEQGLRFLQTDYDVTLQRWIPRAPDDLTGDHYSYGGSSLALWALANHGHLAGNDPDEDVYQATVATVLDGLLRDNGRAPCLVNPNILECSSCPNTCPNTWPSVHANIARGASIEGVADQNQNGLRTRFSGGHAGYLNGIFGAACIAQGQRDRQIIGPSPLEGWTHFEFIEDLVDGVTGSINPGDDCSAHGPCRGGWDYPGDPRGSRRSDNSINGWRMIFLEGAEREWGIDVPDWVKQEVEYTLVSHQNAGAPQNRGFFGYQDDSAGSTATTAAGVTGLVFAGTAGAHVLPGQIIGSQPPPYDSIQAKLDGALDIIGRYWDEPGGATHNFGGGNHGNPYVMWSVARALRMVAGDGDPILLTHDGVRFDWELGYQPDLGVYAGMGESREGYIPWLVRNQNPEGSWISASNDYSPSLTTAMMLLVLGETVFPVAGCAVPVAAPIDVRPGNAEIFPAGQGLVLSGRAVPATQDRDVLAVLVDGQPAQAQDDQGRFFQPVTVTPGTNVHAVTVVDSCTIATFEVSFEGRDPAVVDVDELLVATELAVNYTNTTFNVADEHLIFDVEVCNQGTHGLVSPLLCVIENVQPPTATLVGAAGLTDAGEPYIEILPGAPVQELAPGGCTPPQSLVFHTPGLQQVTFDVSFLARGNYAPTITSTPELRVEPGGAYLYDAEADDPNDANDTGLTWSLLQAPAGIAIDAQTGELSWDPVSNVATSHQLRIRVEDDEGAGSEQAWRLDVSPTVNRSPFFVTLPVLAADEGAPYAYDADALDLDLDVPTYSLMDGPAGMTVDGATGVVSWIPTATDGGARDVIVKADDGQGGVEVQAYTLQVADTINVDPEITSAPVTDVGEGSVYAYQVLASDPDGDELLFALAEGPGGMTIEMQTGLVQWAPGLADVGVHPVMVHADDLRGGVALQAFDLTVRFVNDAPVITSTPVTHVFAGLSYAYDVEADDLDLQVLDYTLAQGPAGMTIDLDTGLIEWSPTELDVGDHAVSVVVTDPELATGMQDFVLTVELNLPPEILSLPRTVAWVDELYTYDADALDPDDIDLTYSLDVAPAGMGIDAANGRLAWTPTPGQEGLQPVVVRAEDPARFFGLQEFDVFVATRPVVADIAPPVVLLVANPPIVDVGTPVTLTVLAKDDAGPPAVNLDVDGVPLALDVNGQAVFTPTTPGGKLATVTATDGAMNEALDRLAILVLDASDVTPPVVSIDAPVPDATVSAPVEVVGTVDDANLVSYRLEIRRNSVAASFQTIAESFAPVVNGVLGTIDPTLLEGGFYHLLLTAVDAGGNQVTTQVQVELTDALVLGAFTLPEVDLRLPVSGIPVEVVRVYDSRVKERRDFGVGWTLQLNSVGFTQTRAPGESWAAVDVGTFLPEWEYQSSLAHVISFQLGAGQAERFLFAPTVDDPTFDPTFGTAAFLPLPGTTASLEVVDTTSLILSGSDLLDPDFEVYDPERYRLHLANGNVVLYDRFEGVQEITEPNGNRMTIGPAGLAHSLGYSTSFTRDPQGRITAVTDPVGNSFMYDYDPAGDLVQVTDPVGGVTLYEYDFFHRLQRIVRPDGTRLDAKYDADGRWIGFVDPGGRLVRFEHDLASLESTVFDPLNGETSFEFDALGNITAETDALGRTTFRAYTPDGLLDVETDRRGFTVDFDYDLAGNVTGYTDAASEEVTIGYDPQGRPTSIEDPLGNLVTNTYDAAGNPLSFTDGSGLVDLAQVNDVAGRPMSISALGEDISVDHDASGRIESVDYSGFMPMELEYDANGNLTRESTQVTTDDGLVTLERSFTYDGLNRLRTATDFAGNQVELTYEAGGQIHSIRDGLGGVTRYTYDAAKNVVGVLSPDGTETTFTHDLVGRVLSRTDELQRTTEFEYDALGRRTRILRPDGTDVDLDYDEEGNLTHVEDGGGRSLDFEYDGRGLLEAIIDGLGRRTEITHDANRNVTHVEDPRGRVTEQRYRYVGLQVGLPDKTVYPDLAEIEHVYVDSVMPEQRKTEDGEALTFTYDANRKLRSVEDPLGNLAQFDYDEMGNLRAFTDARSNATTYAYDAAGRRTRRTSPGAANETWSYDAAGNLVEYKDEADISTSFTPDALGRLMERTVGGITTSFEYGPTGALDEVTYDGRTSTFTYDLRDRLRAAENADGSSVSYDHDGSSNVLHVESDGRRAEYSYDAGSRLTRVDDPDGGATVYDRDLAGVLQSATLPNGVVVAWGRDLRDRVTSIEVRKADTTLLWSVAYTLDAVGRRRSAVESSGRTVAWDYDVAGRLVEETVDTGSGPSTTTFGYDAVGNLTSRDVDGTLTTYAFDVDDRLTSSSDGTTYTYDAKGSLRQKTGLPGTRTYDYDARNRLVGFTDENGVTTSYEYAWDDLLIRKLTAGVETRFEWDRIDRSGVPQLIRILEDGVTTEFVRGVGWNYLKGPAGIRYLHSDGLGSVRVMTDSAGDLVSTADYEAWGQVESISGPDAFPVGFAGEYRDPASGLTFLRARWYDPELGRFLTRDPFDPHRTNPVALHRYLYANADPINNTDPTGRFTLANIVSALGINGVLSTIFAAGSGLLTYFGLDLDEIEEELDTFFDEIPGLKLDGAVDKAYEILNDMTGESKILGDLIDKAIENEKLRKGVKDRIKKLVGIGIGHEVVSLGLVGLWHWNAQSWLGYLPEKGDYYECEFNEYVAKLFLLEIVNKHGGKFTPTFRVLGYYMSYITYLELMAVTVDAASIGFIPEQPPEELAEGYECFFSEIEILTRKE